MAEQEDVNLECPACRGLESSLLFRSKNGYPIVRCARCTLAFSDVRSAPHASSLYPEFDQSEAFVPLMLRRWLSVFMLQREAIVRDVKPTGRLLDFGCGNGAFARWMANAGYDVVGLEPFSLRRPIESPNLRLIGEPLESAAPRLGQFDVITLWQVLEHVNNPIEVLRGLSGLLSPDGVMIVSVPNFQSWQSRIFRGRWFHLDPPRHVIQFEPQTLTDCLREAGLRVGQSWDFLPEYGSSGWIQSLLNEVLPHSNYLYEVVKDRGALRELSFAEHALHLTTSVAASVPTLIATMPVEALASAFHRGATLTVAARKNSNGQS